MTKSIGVSTRPPKPVLAEVRERAVRLVAEQRPAHATKSAAFRSIAEQIVVRRRPCGCGCVGRSVMPASGLA